MITSRILKKKGGEGINWYKFTRQERLKTRIRENITIHYVYSVKMEKVHRLQMFGARAEEGWMV
jgi:hypothetical protein